MRRPASVELLRWGPSSAGFTLVELLITIVVLAILAAIALPSYLDSVRKGRRSDAVSRLTQVQQAQERWRANQPTYTASLTQLGASEPMPGSYYALAITNPTASAYTATATALTDGPQKDDTARQVFTLDSNGGTISYASTNRAGTVNSNVPNPCWNR